MATSPPPFPASTSVPSDATDLARAMFAVAGGRVVRALLTTWAWAAEQLLRDIGMREVQPSGAISVFHLTEACKAYHRVACRDLQSGLNLQMTASVHVAHDAGHFGSVVVRHELTCEDEPGSVSRRILYGQELLRTPLLSPTLLRQTPAEGYYFVLVERHLTAWLAHEFPGGLETELLHHLRAVGAAMEP